MIGPTSAPIAFALPPLMRSTTSGFSAITRATIAASSSPSPIAARPSRSTISSGSPPVGDERVEHLARGAGVTVPAARGATSLASACGATFERAGSASASSRRDELALTQFATAGGSSAVGAASASSK